MHGTRVCPPGKIVTLYEKRYFVYVPQGAIYSPRTDEKMLIVVRVADFEFPECSETDLWLQLKCGQWKESSCPSLPPRIDCDSFTEFDRQSFKPPTDQPGRIVIVNGDSHITYIRKGVVISL
ncbi:hypothetical protein PHLCEN_2v4815 [Hermanssonia centrifuga]|uniref:Uncharacterized protein n=1 Tax=Hermanssonia centrifuga TaxID=98765 RepID=A0A2R6PGA8_9APHY|nr:hypothetical protein PHLCEN_2v4815 [Hermanssonia centrifuga]